MFSNIIIIKIIKISSLFLPNIVKKVLLNSMSLKKLIKSQKNNILESSNLLSKVSYLFYLLGIFFIL